MKTIKMNYTIAALVACSASLSQGALTSWTGTNSGDWSDGGNWSAGVPADYIGSITGRTNGVTIDGSLANQPTTNVPLAFDALSTPNMTLSGGATLSLLTERGNGGTGHGNGEIANVSGAGSHLTLTGRGSTEFQLSREYNGTEIWNVSNGGKVTLLASTRTDMGFNSARLTEMNLDNGTIEISSNQIFGTRGNGDFSTGGSEISLDNGSLMDFAGFFDGNMWDTNGNATVSFDFKDTNSILRFRAGTAQGVFGIPASIDAAFGTTFTTSLAGGTLMKRDIGGGDFEVYVVPEPSSLALLGLGGFALLLRRRK